MAYMKALGLFNSIFIFGFYALYQGASIFANVWLTQWTTDPILSNSTIPANSTDYINQRDMYLGVYGAAGGMQGTYLPVLPIGLVRSREYPALMIKTKYDFAPVLLLSK